MVILPIAVGTWWYKSIQYSCEQILLETSKLYLYYFHKTPTMQSKRVLMILAGSWEFEKGHNNEVQERPSDNLELPELMRDLPNLRDKNREPPFCHPYSVKARALIHAHLSRLELPRLTLKSDLDLILQKSPFLIQEMVNIVSQLIVMVRQGSATNMPQLETVENCMRVSQMMVQGLWDKQSPLLQLPHLNQENLRHFTTKKRSVRSIKQLASMKDVDRRALLRNLTGEQYEDVINVCSMFPSVEMAVKPHVLDDDDDDAGVITAGAVVTVSVTIKRRNLGELFEEENEDDRPVLDGVNRNETLEPKGSPQPGGQKVWQKNKKKGKKAKPQKQQPKKKPVKQQPKKKNSQDKKEKTTEEKEESNGKKNKKEEEEEDEGVEAEKEEVEDEEEDHDEAEDDNTNDKIEEIKKERRKPEEQESDLDSSSFGEDDDSDAPHDVRARDSEDEDEWDRLQAESKTRDAILDPKSKESHIVHAPYFPEEKHEWWWIYVTDRRRSEIMTLPQMIYNLKDEEKLDLKFQAPHKTKTYHYTVTLRSDSYLDFDVHQNFNITVEEAKEIVTKQWDSDSDEEDKDDLDESGESEEEEYSD